MGAGAQPLLKGPPASRAHLHLCSHLLQLPATWPEDLPAHPWNEKTDSCMSTWQPEATVFAKDFPIPQGRGIHFAAHCP